MVSFELTPAQLEWQKKAREFAEKEIRPASLRIDRSADLEHRFDWDILKKMAGEGYTLMPIPREYGGLELDTLTMAIILEELGAGDAGLAFTAGGGIAPVIATYGTEEQKRKFIPPLCSRDNPKLSAFALTEPGAGSDSASQLSTARLDGSEWVLNGTKCFISQGGLASLYLIFVSTDRSKGVRGISAFIVPADTPGLSAAKVEDKMGFRSSQTAEIVINDVRVPKDNLLGAEGGGFPMAMKFLDIARVHNAGAVAVGVARAAFQAAYQFARESIASDRAGFENQSTYFSLVDMATAIETTRLLVWKTCWQMDNNLPASKESSMVKFFASDMAMKVTSDAMQIVGLHGYTDQYPVEKYMRDVKLLQIYEGTNQVNRLVVSRQLG